MRSLLLERMWISGIAAAMDMVAAIDMAAAALVEEDKIAVAGAKGR